MESEPTSSRSRNGSPSLKLDPIQQVEPGADLDAAIAQYERLATALSGFIPALDLHPNSEKQTRQLHAYAKLLSANASYMLELDGVVLELSPMQRERLEDAADEIEELIDTLEWATDKRPELLALIDENRAS
jgi:hypothetical protein